MAPTNGSTADTAVVPFKELTPAEVAELTGKRITSVYGTYDRLFPSFDSGKVFDQGTADARDLRGMLRQDGNARKVEQVLTLPIRSAAWEIRPAPGGAKEAAWINAQLADKLDRVIDQATTAVVFRKAFFELTFRLAQDGSGVELAAIDYRPPAGCEQGHDPKTGEPDGFRQLVAYPVGMWAAAQRGKQGGAIRADITQDPRGTAGYKEVPQSRSFVFVHGSYAEPIEGLSDLDVAWWVYSTVKKIQFLWFQFLEQQSLPKTIAYGDDITQADANADAIAAAKASGVLAMQRPSEPGARAFDVIQSSGAGAGQFLEAINYLEGKMSAAVLAGFTDLAGIAAHSRGGSGGSFALSADQSEFFLAARQAVADEIADAISRDLFTPLCQLEFGEDCKPPTLEIGPLSKRDKDRALNLMMALLTADHFNAPPGMIDLLIKATAGYVGLPVDAVSKLVDEHPATDPAAAPAAPPTGTTAPADGLPPLPEDPSAPVGTGGTSVADTPPAAVSQLAGLSHVVALAHELVTRYDNGEDPQDAIDAMSAALEPGPAGESLALARHVRTEAGAHRYGLPIGSLIVGKPGSHANLVANGLVGKGSHKAAGAASAKAPSATKARQKADYDRLVTMRDQAVKSGPKSRAALNFRQALDDYKTKYPAKPKTEPVPEHLKNLKAQADKLGPNSGAHAQYQKELAKHQAEQDAAAKAEPEPKAEPKVKAEPPPKPPASKPVAPKPTATAPPKPATAGKVTTPKAVADDYRNSVTLSDAEKAAVTSYADEGFYDINRGLRGQSVGTDRSKEAQAITALASRYQLPDAITAFRGLDADALPAGDVTGQVVTSPGFSSTAIADTAPGSYKYRDDIMHITIPKGMNGVAVNGTGLGRAAENEFVLPHNTRFRVDSVSFRPMPEDPGTKQRILKVTALPPEA